MHIRWIEQRYMSYDIRCIINWRRTSNICICIHSFFLSITCLCYKYDINNKYRSIFVLIHKSYTRRSAVHVRHTTYLTVNGVQVLQYACQSCNALSTLYHINISIFTHIHSDTWNLSCALRIGFSREDVRSALRICRIPRSRLSCMLPQENDMGVLVNSKCFSRCK